MLTHSDIWAAIDALARDHGLTVSALARRAGLDPTTFNKSKRVTREGKFRWPSTESIAKVLEATGAPFSRFVAYIDDRALGPEMATLPLIGLSQAAGDSAFDPTGRPTGNSWDEIPFPTVEDPHAYGMEVSGSAMEPLFRDGDIVIVSPSASVRRGDRVAAKTISGEILLKQIVRQTAKRVDLAPFNSSVPARSFTTTELVWVARIIWASQ